MKRKSLSNEPLSYGVFPLLDSDSYDDSDGIGCYCFLKKSVHWTYVDSYSDADGYCTQFETDISTNKVILK